MNKQLHTALAAQLTTENEISFMYAGLIIYVHDHSTEGWEFDIGERDSEEETNHLDGGCFSGTAYDVIQSIVEQADDLRVEFAEVIAANLAHERDENRGVA